jgi:cytochrome c biogenesis protein CcmG/thiol:disulfide interchange protein DsbE
MFLVLLLAAGCDRGDHPQHVGRLAPDFSLTDGSRTVRLADYRGKVVLVNFWATWCTPCLEELPSLEALQKEMPQIVILAVSIDEDTDAYHRFLADHQVTLLTVNDPTQRVNALYGTHLFPETYVVDRSGYIRRKFVIAQNWTSPEILNYLKHL